MSVTEYEKKYTELSKYATTVIADERLIDVRGLKKGYGRKYELQ